MKYTDYALGRFLEQRAQQARGSTTRVFVVTADHGANARGTTRIPVDKYLIPLFVYAPKHIAPRRVDRLMSQIDIAPTLLGLLDFDYYSKFFGRDVLAFPAGFGPRVRRQLPDARLPARRRHRRYSSRSARPRRSASTRTRIARAVADPEPAARGDRLLPGRLARLPERALPRRGAAPAGPAGEGGVRLVAQRDR